MSEKRRLSSQSPGKMPEMINRRKTKPHRVKWAEAERELAIRGVVLPTYYVNEEPFSWPESAHVPQTVEEPGPGEAGPDPKSDRNA